MCSRVAVVIPTYNRYEYLREAIGSVLAQSRKPDEIIVVDDGSSDATPNIQAEFPQVTYYRKPNGGLSAARNYGAARSQADLFMFLDDDDRLTPDALEFQEKALADNPSASLVYARAYLIDAQGRRIGEHLRNHRPPADAIEAFLVDNYILIQTVMVRRELWSGIDGFRSLLGEDLDFYIRAARAGFQFVFVDRPLAEYRKLPGTMSANKLKYAEAILKMIQLNFADPGLPKRSGYYTAFYHYRVGRAAYECQDFGRARGEFWKAAWGRPLQPYFWIYWVLAWFPAAGKLVSAVQQLKRRVEGWLVRLGWREKRWGSPPSI